MSDIKIQTVLQFLFYKLKKSQYKSNIKIQTEL